MLNYRKAMQLREVKVLHPPKAQTEEVCSTTLRVGEKGIKKLTSMNDGKVLVEGARSSYILWPANVEWAEPEQSPILSEGDKPSELTPPVPALPPTSVSETVFSKLDGKRYPKRK